METMSRRKHHNTNFYWKKWKEEGKITPMWFLASQLPTCLSRKSSREEDGYHAKVKKMITK